MEQFPIRRIDPCAYFPQLAEIPQPPKQLFVRGTVDLTKKKLLAVVGSRACTPYGTSVCRDLINGLRGYPIVIVSGLALGIDSVAHRAALDAGLETIAFPGSSLEWSELYPSNHRTLAEEILERGGALCAEHARSARGAYWLFPERNRLIAGISDMTLIIEAEEKSGTLITARLATEYNKTVGAIPGNITSPMSRGANWLLRLGATPIRSSEDILLELGFDPGTKADPCNLTEDEERIVELLTEPLTRDAIIERLGMPPNVCAITLSSLEIKGVVRESLGFIERTI